MNRKYAVWLTAALYLVCVAAPSFGCAVCFGDSDSPMARGVQLSVLLMVAVTYLLIGGGLAMFLVLRSRARRRTAAESAAVPGQL